MPHQEPHFFQLALGLRLTAFFNVEDGGAMSEWIARIRERIAKHEHKVLPTVHIQDDIALDLNEYVLFVWGIEVDRGIVMIDWLPTLVEQYTFMSRLLASFFKYTPTMLSREEIVSLRGDYSCQGLVNLEAVAIRENKSGEFHYD